MATLVATSPPPIPTHMSMYASGHASPSTTYSPPPPPPPPPPPADKTSPSVSTAAVASASSSASTILPTSPPTSIPASTPFSHREPAHQQLRPAKDIATFNSLLPPSVEFVEGSSSGTLAIAAVEGKYEPINVSPKANGASELHPAPRASLFTPAKKLPAGDQETRALFTRPIELSWPANKNLGSGLYNNGNTCFLNSALQCLLHTPPLLRMLEAHSTVDQCRVKSGFCMACSMKQVMATSYSKGHAFSPGTITNNLSSIAKHLRKGRQEDSHEFLRYAIDSLQKSCLSGYPPKLDHKIAETTWVHKIFGGKLRSRVTCQQCGHNSDTFDSILDLSIDIYNVNGLKEALRKFTAPDYLKGADKYKCEKCKKPVNAEKRFTIHDAPAVLTVHMKRFTPLGRKLTHPVRYDERLNLQQSMSEGQFGPTYSLYGVISHVGGGPNSGHYFAHVRGADGKWYEMNDDSVDGVRGPPANTKTAYMLFYIREKGQALEAALNGHSLASGMRKRRVVPSDDEGKDDDADDSKSGKAAQVLIGPVIPAHLRMPNGQMKASETPKSDPQADSLKQKINAVEKDKERIGKVQQAGSRTMKPLVDYEDDSDVEKGERVTRNGQDVAQTSSDGAGADTGAGPSSSPLPTNKDRMDLDNDDQPGNGGAGTSSPGLPPTSPVPTPSPAATIAPINFYGASSTSSKASDSRKRKSPDGDESSTYATDVRKASPLSYSSSGWKERSTPTPTPRQVRGARSLYGGSGNPYAKGRLGNNLGSAREDREERELMQPRKLHQKQYTTKKRIRMPFT